MSIVCVWLLSDERGVWKFPHGGCMLLLRANASSVVSLPRGGLQGMFSFGLPWRLLESGPSNSLRLDTMELCEGELIRVNLDFFGENSGDSW